MDSQLTLPSLPSPTQAATLALSAFVVYKIWLVIYNLYFHPLAHFPGPRVAAATELWLPYRELYKGESLSDLRVRVHQQYGDIVRIGPNELHFARPTAYNEIYNMKHRWAKDYRLYRAFNLDSSSFSTTDIVASKRRRHVLSTLFSRQAISNMQGLVRDRITDMCDVLKRRDNAGKSSDLFFGFRGFTTDTITSFCFAKNFHATNAPEFEAPLIVALEQCLPSITLCKYFGSMLWVMNSIPEAIISKLSAPMAAVLLLKKTLLEQIKAVLRDPSVLENAPHPIIYHALLSPEINKGHALPSELGLLHEAQVLFSAGSDTVGTALMVAAFHLLHQPEQQRRLEEELRAAWPVLEEQPRFEALEKLPYLTAVVKETLRVSPGTPAGLPRVVPAAGAMLSGAFIPGGTIVSQSPLFVHNSEQIFPNAHVFDPERWMQPNSSQLETHLVAFSKGPRSCLGINLAYCELYLCLATVFRQFDVRLDTTKAAELSWTEHFLPHFHGEHLRAFCTPRSE
ncbi:putative P450 monooxygenase [Auriscalpium vulgare]|uniref:P450 monooxygenase n=1 Tax=Auriscalpium vulgare TaxID=40419 RepID=A0ACB8RW55_9AGAM|nr:putative P450 monooxygenase [Auriscalpium vulgare]